MRVSTALIALQATSIVLALPTDDVSLEIKNEVFGLDGPSKVRKPWLPWSCGKCPKNHHCLMIPNGYETCVWEGFHSREYCIDPGQKLWKRSNSTEDLDTFLSQLEKNGKGQHRAQRQQHKQNHDEEEVVGPDPKSMPQIEVAKHDWDKTILTAHCGGVFDVCAEQMPSDGTQRGYCINSPFWMQWDACRNYKMGVKKSKARIHWDLLQNFMETMWFGSRAKRDPCDKIWY